MKEARRHSRRRDHIADASVDFSCQSCRTGVVPLAVTPRSSQPDREGSAALKSPRTFCGGSKVSKIAVLVAATALAFVPSSGSTPSTSGSAGAVAAAFGLHTPEGVPNAIAPAAVTVPPSTDTTAAAQEKEGLGR
jgi:hypothetical protein